MTKITIDRAVVEQALHVATGAGYPLALIAALKAALSEPQEPGFWGRVAARQATRIKRLETTGQQALEAMEREAEYFLQEHSEYNEVLLPAIEALKAALAEPVQEPVQEPVAWRFQSAVGGWAYGSQPPLGSKYPVHPLYAAPPQRPAEPVQEPSKRKLVPTEPTIGMCIAGDEARQNVDDLTRTPAIYRAMIAAAPASPQQAEPVQEPVAWAGYDLDGMVEAFSRVIEAHFSSKHPFHNPIHMDAQTALRILRGFIPAMKAYATPPQRKPLTDEEKRALADKFLHYQPESYEVSGVFDLISAVERAHKIGGEG